MSTLSQGEIGEEHFHVKAPIISCGQLILRTLKKFPCLPIYVPPPFISDALQFMGVSWQILPLSNPVNKKTWQLHAYLINKQTTT